jgi:hypothetical protein
MSTNANLLNKALYFLLHTDFSLTVSPWKMVEEDAVSVVVRQTQIIDAAIQLLFDSSIAFLLLLLSVGVFL